MASQEFQEDRSLDVHLRGSSSEKAHSFGAAGTQQVPRLRFRRANKNRPPSQGAPVEDAHACPVPCCESAESPQRNRKRRIHMAQESEHAFDLTCSPASRESQAVSSADALDLRLTDPELGEVDMALPDIVGIPQQVDRMGDPRSLAPDQMMELTARFNDFFKQRPPGHELELSQSVIQFVCSPDNPAEAQRLLQGGSDATPQLADGPRLTANRPVLLHKNGQWTPHDSPAEPSYDSKDRNDVVMNAEKRQPRSHVLPEMDRHFNAAAHLPKVDPFSTDGASPLHLAVHYNRGDLVDILLSQPSCNIRAVNAQGRNVLHVAAEQGNAHLLHRLARIVPFKDFIDAVDYSQHTPLHLAVYAGREEAVIELWERRCKIEAMDVNGWTALHYAAALGRSDIVSRLIIAGSKVHALDKQGLSPGHRAAQFGQDGVLQTLLHAGLEVEFMSGISGDGGFFGFEAATPLHVAARFGHRQFIARLVEAGASVHRRDSRGYNALHYAAVGGCMGTFQQLLDMGADPLGVSSDGITVLHTAAAGSNWAICQQLLKLGCDVNSRSSYRQTPLHCSAAGHSTEVARGLVECSAELNCRDQAGNTPWHIAAKAGQTNMMLFLLEAGSDKELRNDAGCTAVHLAAQSGALGVLEMLKEHGARMAATCSAGKTALHYASINSASDQVVRLLLQVREVKDAVSLPDEKGWTVLHYAVMHGNTGIVELLLQAQADVNCQTLEGWSALHLAVREQRLDLADHLLQQNCLGSLKDGKGRTPLHWAASQADATLFYSLYCKPGCVCHDADAQGYTPLHCAVEGGNQGVVDVLLDTSAYEDTEAAKPRTSPMHVAVQHGHVHLLDRLLKHGYSHLERTPDGKSTIHLAAGGCISGPKSAHGPSAVDRQLDCLLRMLDLKVDPMLLDSDGCSALHCAAGSGNEKIFHHLVGLKLDINLLDERGWTPIIWAARSGHLPIVKHLIEAGVDIVKPDQRGRTALHWAAVEGQMEVVGLLVDCIIEAGLDVHIKDAEGLTPAELAAGNGHVRIVERILESASPQGEKKMTALHLATQGNFEHLVGQLLELPDTSPSVADADGLTPLHWAATKGLLPIVKQLLAAGADVNKVTNDGWTALHEAAANSHATVVEALLAAKSPVDARTSNGSTALHSAAANGQMQIVEQLLQQNCNVNIRALTGATALYGAATAGHLEVAKRLIEHGGDLTIATTAGSIPLHSAASSGHIEVVKLLLNAGSKKALIDAQAQNGATALHGAAANGHADVVRELLLRGCDADVQNSNCSTALHLAASKGHLDVVECLLEHRADVHIKNSKGWTALHSAAAGGYFEVVLELVRHGGIWKNRADGDVIKMIIRKSSLKASYVEGRLKLAEKERRKEKARGVLQSSQEPSAEELRERERKAQETAEALLRELESEGQKLAELFEEEQLKIPVVQDLELRKVKKKKKKKGKGKRTGEGDGEGGDAGAADADPNGLSFSKLEDRARGQEGEGPDAQQVEDALPDEGSVLMPDSDLKDTSSQGEESVLLTVSSAANDSDYSPEVLPFGGSQVLLEESWYICEGPRIASPGAGGQQPSVEEMSVADGPDESNPGERPWSIARQHKGSSRQDSEKQIQASQRTARKAGTGQSLEEDADNSAGRKSRQRKARGQRKQLKETSSARSGSGAEDAERHSSASPRRRAVVESGVTAPATSLRPGHISQGPGLPSNKFAPPRPAGVAQVPGPPSLVASHGPRAIGAPHSVSTLWVTVSRPGVSEDAGSVRTGAPGERVMVASGWGGASAHMLQANMRPVLHGTHMAHIPMGAGKDGLSVGLAEQTAAHKLQEEGQSAQAVVPSERVSRVQSGARAASRPIGLPQRATPVYKGQPSHMGGSHGGPALVTPQRQPVEGRYRMQDLGASTSTDQEYLSSSGSDIGSLGRDLKHLKLSTGFGYPGAQHPQALHHRSAQSSGSSETSSTASDLQVPWFSNSSDALAGSYLHAPFQTRWPSSVHAQRPGHPDVLKHAHGAAMALGNYVCGEGMSLAVLEQAPPAVPGNREKEERFRLTKKVWQMATVGKDVSCGKES